jgi:hypothetical protein
LRTFARVLGIAVVVAATALGTASPSSADQTMQGHYAYSAPGMPPASWTILPICVPVVGDWRVPLELPVACTLHVVSATKKETTPELQSLNWAGDAHLTGGVWEVIVNRSDGFQCPDGSSAPLFRTYQFDDVTMTGTLTATNNAGCGAPAGMTKTPFTLAFTGPLANPVEQYPLICEPAGLRLCR